MAIRITNIAPKISTSSVDVVAAHSTIDQFKWVNEETSQTGVTSMAGMFDWLVNKKGQAYIRKGTSNGKIPVFGTVTPGGQRYLRCLEDGNWTNDLLDLPQI